MADSSKLTISNSSNNFLSLIKGVFWALSTSLICVLVFAFIIKLTAIPENLITPINQVIKILSIFLGCFVMSKKIKSNGWLWGIMLGLIYTLLAFLIFSILDGEFRITLNLLNDLVFGSILGLICGIIAISIRK